MNLTRVRTPAAGCHVSRLTCCGSGSQVSPDGGPPGMTSPGKKATRRARGHNGIGISAAGALVRTPSAGPAMTRLILAVRLGRAGCRGSDIEDVVQDLRALVRVVLATAGHRRIPSAPGWTTVARHICLDRQQYRPRRAGLLRVVRARGRPLLCRSRHRTAQKPGRARSASCRRSSGSRKWRGPTCRSSPSRSSACR